MSRPVATNFEERQRQIVRDIASLKRIGRYSPPPSSGTVAERDAYFGIPATPAERVALAGSMWTDTDLGLDFRYYAASTDTGAPANRRALAAGWYPADVRMPYVLVDRNTTQTIATTTATLVTLRTAGTPPGQDVFGMWNSANPNRLTAPFSGFYRVNAKIRTNGIVGAVLTLRRDGTEYTRARAGDVGASGAATTPMIDVPVYIAAGSYIEMWITMAAATSQNILPNESFIEMRYEGPVPA